MEYIVEARSKQKKAFVEHMLPKMIKQLGLTKSKKVLLVRVANECDEGNDGQTMPIPAIDSIIVVLKPKPLDLLGITLAHEMVHVKQIARGTLKSINGVNYWNGKRVHHKTKYLNKPWEIEAFSKQELIFRRALEN